MNEITDRIEKLFKKNNGFIRTKDILDAGIHNIYLKKLVEEGRIEKIKHGLYRWIGMNDTQHQGLLDVSMAIPGGIICLLSALSYYNLSTVKPLEISIAVENKRRVTKPEYPPVKVYYFSQSMFNTGVEKVKIGGINVLIYNKEKTICDCIKYRKQLGLDIVKESLREYLKNSNRDIKLLTEYAEICKIKGIFNNYLEVLV